MKLEKKLFCLNREDFRLVLMKMGFSRQETNPVIDALPSVTSREHINYKIIVEVE